ncbi:hypothetical protein [Microbulbifer yueqingensis]|uniref:hypothetical protein n=1 Tax=Microbulbifer yueqingensis TaxID=658219 RepID=UPI00111455B5|nr:hypothetical protein [Microbulbifer yueqingensis]
MDNKSREFLHPASVTAGARQQYQITMRQGMAGHYSTASVDNSVNELAKGRPSGHYLLQSAFCALFKLRFLSLKNNDLQQIRKFPYQLAIDDQVFTTPPSPCGKSFVNT